MSLLYLSHNPYKNHKVKFLKNLKKLLQDMNLDYLKDKLLKINA